MAVAFDALGAPGAAGNTSSTATGAVLTWTHTAVAASVAIVAGYALGQGTGSLAGTVAVTCDGNAMTQLGVIDSDNQTGTASSGKIFLFGIAGQSSGAHTIVITVTGGTASLRSNVAGSVSYSGADPVSPFGTAVTNFGNSTAPAVTVSGTTAGNMVAGVAAIGTSTLSNPATSRWVNNFSPSNGAGNAGQVDRAAGGSVTLTWSGTTLDFWGAVGVEIKAAWSVLQSATATSVGTTVAATFSTANLSSGSKLIALVVIAGNNVASLSTTVSDGHGNNFTSIATLPSVTTTKSLMGLFYLDTPAGDVGTKPTITATGAISNGASISIQEVAGLAPGAPDGTAGTLNAGTSGSTGNFSTGSPT